MTKDVVKLDIELYEPSTGHSAIFSQEVSSRELPSLEYLWCRGLFADDHYRRLFLYDVLGTDAVIDNDVRIEIQSVKILESNGTIRVLNWISEAAH